MSKDGMWSKREWGAEADIIGRQGDGRTETRITPIRPGDRDPAIYFVTTVGQPLLKIGTVLNASRIQHRLAMIQTGCPYALKLELMAFGLGRQAEARLHKVFDPHRFRSEWFTIEGLVAEVLALARSNPDAANKWIRAAISHC